MKHAYRLAALLLMALAGPVMAEEGLVKKVGELTEVLKDLKQEVDGLKKRLDEGPEVTSFFTEVKPESIFTVKPKRSGKPVLVLGASVGHRKPYKFQVSVAFLIQDKNGKEIKSEYLNGYVVNRKFSHALLSKVVKLTEMWEAGKEYRIVVIPDENTVMTKENGSYISLAVMIS